MNLPLREFLQAGGNLPSLPLILIELNRAVANPNLALSSIADIIRTDQSLTTRLLKLANSSLYSFPSRIGTIEDALQLIGLREIQDLALATCAIQAFKNLPAHVIEVPSYWRHSVACATAAALLAERRHDPAPERYFVGGLLHEVGRLLIILRAPAAAQEILERCDLTRQLASTVEREVLGFDHAMLGAELIDAWKLPRSLREMVRHHHQPDRSTFACLDATLVHCADFLTHALEFGRSGEEFVAPLLLPAGGNFQVLEASQVEAIAAELDARCAQLFPILTPGSDD